MKKTVYVGGSTKDQERVKLVQEAIVANGGEISFDWTGAEGKILDADAGDNWDQFPEDGERIAQREIDAATFSDLTIILFPPSSWGLGCWIEMGAALAGGSDVWLVEARRDAVFWWHPNVRVFNSFEDLMKMISIRDFAVRGVKSA